MSFSDYSRSEIDGDQKKQKNNNNNVLNGQTVDNVKMGLMFPVESSAKKVVNDKVVNKRVIKKKVVNNKVVNENMVSENS